ncbi:MAG: aldo/keto reductase [Theionarchaea archaeon]|nr:aldo/keto reductase [Theionarchaea archaeon]MBU7000344.1 aldo/keto reductase [Theionarchaea archaeon]MBU7020627.1 aldo/keto reductase [Theionarchaea archaeon]MBU7035196.1 aldo/keto reductase [Theionarchaea archaeon]MBU7040434.1 aldo/keto reductase [Theionarchaea archaeon]
MRAVELGKTGEKIPVIGQGTWGLSRWKSAEYYQQWKRVLHQGISLGMTHIDTAEVYGMGMAERIVGEVVKEYPRDELFIASKLFPFRFFHNSIKKAAYKSLERLHLDYLDLYLVHWPNPVVSIEKHMRALEALVEEGKTRFIGVSNYSVNQVEIAMHALKKTELVTNQVKASVTAQKHLKDLPFYRKEKITLTAYSPLGHRGLATIADEQQKKLTLVAEKYNVTIQQVALSWLVSMEGVITIPKTVTIDHVKANARAAETVLPTEEIRMLWEDSQ